MLSEQELLQRMAETIEATSGMVLEPEGIKTLLLEVQREQLKGLVYRAFMAVNQAHEAEQNGEEPKEQPADEDPSSDT